MHSISGAGISGNGRNYCKLDADVEKGSTCDAFASKRPQL